MRGGNEGDAVVSIFKDKETRMKRIPTNERHLRCAISPPPSGSVVAAQISGAIMREVLLPERDRLGEEFVDVIFGGELRL